MPKPLPQVPTPKPVTTAGRPVRDLKTIAQAVAGHPSLWKQFLHSHAFSTYRRLRTKGAWAQLGQTVISAGLGQIPIPGVSGVAQRAFDNTCNLLRTRRHRSRAAKASYAVDPQEKIKFELKELASSVANWDNYRWKVTHAIKQYNEAVKEMVSGQGTPNCDAWVNAYAKYYYIHKRTDEFAASVLAVKTLATEIEKWLADVDHNVDAEEQKLAAAYYQGYNALKETPEDEHKENCTKEKCMFSTASWLDASYVPTSDAALWVQNIGGKVWGWGVGDPLTAATGTGLAQADQSVPSGLF